MTPAELIVQQADRDAVKASQRLESKAATAVNASFRQQDKEPFGTLPSRAAVHAITTELAPEPMDGTDVGATS